MTLSQHQRDILVHIRKRVITPAPSFADLVPLINAGLVFHNGQGRLALTEAGLTAAGTPSTWNERRAVRNAEKHRLIDEVVIAAIWGERAEAIGGLH